MFADRGIVVGNRIKSRGPDKLNERRGKGVLISQVQFRKNVPLVSIEGRGHQIFILRRVASPNVPIKDLE